jgi:hypothetical protein
MSLITFGTLYNLPKGYSQIGLYGHDRLYHKIEVCGKNIKDVVINSGELIICKLTNSGDKWKWVKSEDESPLIPTASIYRPLQIAILKTDDTDVMINYAWEKISETVAKLLTQGSCDLFYYQQDDGKLQTFHTGSGGLSFD